MRGSAGFLGILLGFLLTVALASSTAMGQLTSADEFPTWVNDLGPEVTERLLSTDPAVKRAAWQQFQKAAGQFYEFPEFSRQQVVALYDDRKSPLGKLLEHEDPKLVDCGLQLAIQLGPRARPMTPKVVAILKRTRSPGREWQCLFALSQMLPDSQSVLEVWWDCRQTSNLLPTVGERVLQAPQVDSVPELNAVEIEAKRSLDEAFAIIQSNQMVLDGLAIAVLRPTARLKIEYQWLLKNYSERSPPQKCLAIAMIRIAEWHLELEPSDLGRLFADENDSVRLTLAAYDADDYTWGELKKRLRLSEHLEIYLQKKLAR